jgi:DNA-binding LacI/PurR family transcriptional regulator
MAKSGSPPTIGSVALAAGVSRSTVSRAFSAPHLLRRETVADVQAAASRLGYVPNPAARALSTGRSGNLGLVVPDITNPFFATLMRGAQARAREAGFVLFLGDADETPELESELLSKLNPQVEGFVLVSPRTPPKGILQAAGRRPLVTINSDVQGFSRVLVDTAPSYTRAVELLVQLGHRSLAYIAGPRLSWSNSKRSQAVVTAAERLGVEVKVYETARPSFEAGRHCALAMDGDEVTAALAFDDTVAQGVVAGLAERGLSVPQDFSVVGCDGVIATTTFPALTSVDAKCRSAGEEAIGLLIEGLRGPAPGDRRVVLPTELVVRASTGPAPKTRSRVSDRPSGRQGPGRAIAVETSR